MSNTKLWFQTRVGKIVTYFLQGLLLIAPIFVTLYVIVYTFTLLDTKFNDFFESVFHIRFFIGFGLALTFALVALIGYVGSSVFVQPVLHLLDLVIEKTPLVKDIYSSLKDFFGAFISNKKKFNKPVLFEMGKGTGVFKMGFITQEDLDNISLPDKVAVYAPWSYNLSGTLFIVNRDQIQTLDDVSAGGAMKFIVSGGVTAIEDEQHHQLHTHEQHHR
jgi:uncharacterized membrane protein